MSTINSFDDILRRHDLINRQPKSILCIGVADLTEWLRSAWNHGKSHGYKEAYDALRTSTAVAAADENANQLEAFQVRCAAILRKQRRADRKRS